MKRYRTLKLGFSYVSIKLKAFWKEYWHKFESNADEFYKKVLHTIDKPIDSYILLARV
jgi:hypothetical protein